jgi:predicted tellurium resistance membrane protein TerC
MTLRALFAILVTLEDQFRYLQHAIAAILSLVGTNMILEAVMPSMKLPLPVMLLIIAVLLVTSVSASVILDEDGKLKAPLQQLPNSKEAIPSDVIVKFEG